MPQVVDRQFFFLGDTRLSPACLPPENFVDEKVGIPHNPAESLRQQIVPGKAIGSVDLPTISLDAPTSLLLTQYDEGTILPYTWFPKSNDGSFALMYLASINRESSGYPDGLGIDRIGLDFQVDRMGGQGQVMHDDFEGLGQTGVFSGSVRTFAAIAAGEAFRIHFAAWSVVGGPGTFDALVESDPAGTFSGSETTRATLATVSSAALPGAGQVFTVEGPITDTFWRIRITAISAGTWFIMFSAEIHKS